MSFIHCNYTHLHSFLWQLVPFIHLSLCENVAPRVPFIHFPSHHKSMSPSFRLQYDGKTTVTIYLIHTPHYFKYLYKVPPQTPTLNGLSALKYMFKKTHCIILKERRGILPGVLFYASTGHTYCCLWEIICRAFYLQQWRTPCYLEVYYRYPICFLCISNNNKHIFGHLTRFLLRFSLRWCNS